MKNAKIAGVDIGGSHITAALIDINTRQIIGTTKKRMEINSKGKAGDIFDSWSNLIKESFKAGHCEPTEIGIAMPGPFDYINGISYIRDQNKYDALYGLNVKEELAERLGIEVNQITLVNDAACFLEGELFAGTAMDYQRVLGLTLGTGLGSAWSLAGKTRDANLWCSPFYNGIAEDYLSTRWFIKRYAELTGNEVNDVKSIVIRVDEDIEILELFNEFGTNLANFLIPHILQEQLQLVVLGGNISLAFAFFSSALKRTFKEQKIKVEISIAELGENASLLGAASSHLNEANSFTVNHRS